MANGTVRPGLSDVDLLSVGLADPPGLGRILSAGYAELGRGVDGAPRQRAYYAASGGHRSRAPAPVRRQPRRVKPEAR